MRSGSFFIEPGVDALWKNTRSWPCEERFIWPDTFKYCIYVHMVYSFNANRAQAAILLSYFPSFAYNKRWHLLWPERVLWQAIASFFLKPMRNANYLPWSIKFNSILSAEVIALKRQSSLEVNFQPIDISVTARESFLEESSLNEQEKFFASFDYYG